MSQTTEVATPEAQQEQQAEQPATGELGDAGKKALEAERKAARAEKKRADELAARLKEIEDRDKSEAEKVAERASAAEARAAELEARAVRLEVAFEKGLTPAQAKRLVGTTREDLEADADEVLRDFPTQPPAPVKPSGDIGQGPRQPAQPTTPQDKIAAGLAQHMK